MKLIGRIRSSKSKATVLPLLISATIMLAQNAGRQAPLPHPSAVKPLAFDVVSIRPTKPGAPLMSGWGTTPDGYRVTGQSFWTTIMIAYFPQGIAYWSKDRLSGAPPWLNNPYEINARVSETDLAEWQKQGSQPLEKKVLLQQMLKTMLAERCHLVAHYISGGQLSGFNLDPGKHGPRLTETKTDETLPTGVPLGSGGILVPYQRGERPHISFYGATIAEFTEHLAIMSHGHPVQDHAGFTGRYDFVLNWVDDPDSKLPAGAISPDDPNPLSHWDIDALGLHLTPIKLPIDTLVIDHIEKPSEN